MNVSLVDAILSSLENQNFFYNGSWKDMAAASEDDVCIFLYCDEEEKPPRGAFPALANCYSPTCEEPGSCYSPSCRNRLRVCRTYLRPSDVLTCMLYRVTGPATYPIVPSNATHQHVIKNKDVTRLPAHIVTR